MNLDVGYRELRRALPADIEQLIQGVHDQLWGFLPVFKFKLFSDRNTTFVHLTNYDVAKQCIRKALDNQLYQDAMDLIFAVDRFAYWKDIAETQELLDMAQHIIDQCPEVAVAPQLILRKIRLLKDRGDYQGADIITNSVLSLAADCADRQDGKFTIATWQFKDLTDFKHTVSLLLMLKGQIQMYLAQPVDAAVYLAASTQLAYSIHKLDTGGHGLQLLIDLLLEMGSSQRQELHKFLMFESCPSKPLIEYIVENGDSVLNRLLPDDNYFLKQICGVTRIGLMRVFEVEKNNPTSGNFRTILRHLKAAIPENLSLGILENRDVARDFAFLIFNVHMIFNHLRHESRDILHLSMQLFIKACGRGSEEDLENFGQAMKKGRSMIENCLGSDMSVDEKFKSQEDVICRYPVLRGSSPEDLLRAFKNAGPPENLQTNTITMIQGMETYSTIDPVATTFVKSGMLPSNASKFRSKLLQFKQEDMCPYCTSSARVTIAEGTEYQSLLSEPIRTVDGFSAPHSLLVEKVKQVYKESKPIAGVRPDTDNASSKQNVSSRMIRNTKLSENTVYQANVAKYYTVEDQWRYQKTLVFIHKEFHPAENKKGRLRDVIKLQYLHQDHLVPEAMYLGKRYRRKTPPSTYHNDVIMHQLSLQCVECFNKKLQPYSKYANRIRMVPVAHMEILDEADRVLEVLNVEPFIEGNFTKMTNNHDKVNPRVDSELFLAFSHFTWCDSGGKFMVTDLQGFIPEDPRIAVILTDPAVNSEHLGYLGITNMGKEGFDAFWKTQHPTCNEICHLLNLERVTEVVSLKLIDKMVSDAEKFKS